MLSVLISEFLLTAGDDTTCAPHPQDTRDRNETRTRLSELKKLGLQELGVSGRVIIPRPNLA
jgi:hypothetical protein